MKSEQLIELFSKYNGKYFSNAIENYTVVAYRHLKSRTGLCDPVTRTIQVDCTLNDEQTKETLLHEMVHAYVGCENGHNSVFNRECERIERLTGLNLRRYRMSEAKRYECNNTFKALMGKMSGTDTFLLEVRAAADAGKLTDGQVRKLMDAVYTDFFKR